MYLAGQQGDRAERAPRRTYRVMFPKSDYEVPYRVEFEAESDAEAVEIAIRLSSRRDAILWEEERLLCIVEKRGVDPRRTQAALAGFGGPKLP